MLHLMSAVKVILKHDVCSELQSLLDVGHGPLMTLVLRPGFCYRLLLLPLYICHKGKGARLLQCGWASHDPGGQSLVAGGMLIVCAGPAHPSSATAHIPLAAGQEMSSGL